MKSINVYKAQPLRRLDDEIDSVDITLGGRGPFPDASPDTAKELFAEDAQLLADALISTLPGGTLDQLTVILLQRKATSLHVPLALERHA